MLPNLRKDMETIASEKFRMELENKGEIRFRVVICSVNPMPLGKKRIMLFPFEDDLLRY